MLQSYFFGDNMSGFIKVKTKELLLNNTFKLFLVTLTSNVLKLISAGAVAASTFLILTSEFFQELLINYNSFLIRFIYSLFTVCAYFLLALFISGLKTGENAIYYMYSKGSKGRFKYLFIFLKPSQSFRSFCAYSKLLFLKFFWALFFYAPPIICLLISLYLYYNTYIYKAVLFTLICGIVFLTSVSRFYYNCAVMRYAFTPYYLCTDLSITVNDAILKSTESCEGFIKDGVYIKASFLPWYLSCIFILPIFYVIPFIKLTKAKYVTFCNGLRHTLPQPVLPYDIKAIQQKTETQ